MENNALYQIRHVHILSIFVVVPVILAIGLWDWFLNDARLSPLLGISSLFLPIYLLIFEIPHIIASFVGFIDKEYIGHYRKHLFFGVPTILGLFFILVKFNLMVAFVFYLTATMYHVIKQQTGIALLFRVPKNKWHTLWTWGLIFSISIVYVLLMIPSLFEGIPKGLIWLFIIFTLLFSVVCGLTLILQTESLKGVLYIILTFAMVGVSYLMLWFGYLFLAVLVVRFVHDITAFLFYITHEINRNAKQVKNILYKFFPLVPLSLVIMVPLLAVFIGLLLRELVTDATYLFSLLMLLGMAHYYLESIMWKRDSLHRQYVMVK